MNKQTHLSTNVAEPSALRGRDHHREARYVAAAAPMPTMHEKRAAKVRSRTRVMAMAVIVQQTPGGIVPLPQDFAPRKTSKTIRTAVENADAVVQARRGIQFGGVAHIQRSSFARISWERVRGGRWQRHCASSPRLPRSTLTTITWKRLLWWRAGAGRDTAPQHHCFVAHPLLQ